jgi:hypothetical protein
MRTRIVALVALAGLLVSAPSYAGHHLWRFTEAYSNTSGSVQFFELFTTAAAEQGVGAFTVVRGPNTMNFVTNLPSSATANTWILCGTSNLASLPGGVAPDYIIPANFLATGGGTLNYASGVDTWVYGALPGDGVNSLHKNGAVVTTGPNDPINFAGAPGSINPSSSLPIAPAWGLALLAGALLLAASGLLRKQETTLA